MYRVEDIEVIRHNMHSIIDKSHNEYKTNYEPTTKEISKVYQTIKNHIIKNKNILYGGFAQNILLMKKKHESFYKIIDGAFYNWPDVADIEFYSPTPIKDLMELCEELYKHGFKYIEGKHGVHPGTYKIYVNFENYCDISYMPLNIYNTLPIINVDGLICTHPHFMLCDAYRVLTDPLTSYYRLEKILRFQSILNYYPITHEKFNHDIKITSNHPDIMKIIRKYIIQKSKLIVIGYYGYDYYVKKIYKNNKEFMFYEVITDNMETELKRIVNTLKKILKDKFNNITTKQYYPYWEFIDKHVEFYYKDNLILRVVNNNKRCTVYRYSKNKHTYYGTYNLVYMYLLFNYFYSHTNKNEYHKNTYMSLLSNLLIVKNEYLEKNKKTVVDKTPFQDFTFSCYGEPMNLLRESRINHKTRTDKFNYIPTGKTSYIPKIIYDNISGNEIFDKKKYFYKNI